MNARSSNQAKFEYPGGFFKPPETLLEKLAYYGFTFLKTSVLSSGSPSLILNPF